MSLRTVFSALIIALSAWTALPAQAQYGYYRYPRPRRVVYVAPPRPVYYAPVVPVYVAPVAPVVVAPAPVIVRARPLWRPRPVVVVRGGRRW
ncbi:hypothetical protein Q5H93_11755 [Hymenobacter sp. ASUV-10]|uniref:Virulence factor n=1 Tax=Hymenobacter aranciens TaxID=3063996 RepID=A0ABT9BAW7_9BACT|nr:hypothetical protein [Hymenobacter sp. ASUV-10]MDO7875407.1 hypothetical protein [Hymenobacter sp. ASUV-10]